MVAKAIMAAARLGRAIASTTAKVLQLTGSPVNHASTNKGTWMTGEGYGNNHHRPFEHESHAAHGKMQHVRAPEIETSHPTIRDKDQIDLKTRSEKILEYERQPINQACDHQELAKRENLGKLGQPEKRNRFGDGRQERMRPTPPVAANPINQISPKAHRPVPR